MGLNTTSYVLSKGYTNQVALGITEPRVEGTTVYFTIAETGEEVSVTLPTPADGTDGLDGISITSVAINDNNHLVCTMSDGNELDAGELPIGEGDGGSGEDNKIESISVNGAALTIDENKNVDITIPEEYDDTELRNQIAELEELASIISDSEVRIDKTYSSSKIYTDIQQALTDSKEYTLAEIGKASGASYKVAASIDEMTDTKYIYLLANGDSYDLYIYEEDTTTATKIGNTTIDLSGYYTKSEVDDTFVLQTVFDVLSGNIGDVANLLTENKTVVDSINEIKENLADYLPLAGGVLTGDLIALNNGLGRLRTDKNHTGVYSHGTEKNYTTGRGLLIFNETYQTDDAKSLVFRKMVDGAMTDYTVLHSGNVNDYVTFSDADTLDGHDSEYFASADDLANYLPLTGGTVTGNLTVNASQFGVVSPNAEATRSYFGNPSRSLMHIVGADGAYGFYDNTNSKFIMQSSTDCTNTFNGTASGNLPLGGGTFDKGANTYYRLKDSGNNAVWNGFVNADGTVFGGIGTYGVDGVGNFIFIGANGEDSYKTANGLSIYSDSIKWKNNDVLHAGNYSNYAMSVPITLWENPDLTAEFASQTVTLDTEFQNCKYYEIICIRRSSSESGRLVTFSSGRIPQEKAVLLNLFTQYYYTRLSNIPSVNNCTITFNNCTAASTYGATTNDITDNTFCVPMTILGYKE